MKISKLLALGVISALLSACAGGTSSVPTTATNSVAQNSIPSRTMSIDGVTVHVLPAQGVVVEDEQGPSGGLRGIESHAASSSGNLTWHGGPVQVSPKIYIVFWGPKWSTGDGEYTTLTGFFNAEAGKSWDNIVTQYTGSNGTAGNPSGQLAGTWIDASSVPKRPGSSAVGAEAQRAVSHFGYGGVDANYIVAIQSGNDPSGFRTSWCAWHSSESETEGVVSYTNLPYQSDAGASCGEGSVNSPGTYDGVSIVGGHEQAETQTDPQPNTGWLDSGGSEIGDKCAWVNLENNPNAGGYPTQPLWDNKISGCAQSGP